MKNTWVKSSPASMRNCMDYFKYSPKVKSSFLEELLIANNVRGRYVVNY
jgi:hypothetical protein